MQSTKIEHDIQKTVNILLDKYTIVKSVVKNISRKGGRSYIVGGAVRDIILGLPIKDLDIEIHGLSPEDLELILKEYGPVSLVGKIFGVFRIHGLDVDWSLPRIDKPGRKPDVTIDPKMTIEQALRRRDLTMNAMAIDLSSGELIDPFNGLQDIKDRVMRSPDPAFFIEDPLRFYRVMQFISRFDMHPDKELETICKKMDVSTVSVERIEQEFRKMLLRSKQPSLGIRWIKSIGRLKELFPELSELVDVPQSKKWHPEGDAFEHTMQVIDAAAQLVYDSDTQKLIIMLAALSHDLGKATTTEKHKGDWRSFGHSKEGVAPTKKLLKRIMRNKDISDVVAKLVRYHMEVSQFVDGNAKPSAYKRLANKLAPDVTLKMLTQLALADKRGRNKDSTKPQKIDEEEIKTFLERAQAAHVLTQKEEPILKGRDLLGKVQAGPEMGRLLKKAYDLQIEEGIKDKKELKRLILKK